MSIKATGVVHVVLPGEKELVQQHLAEYVEQCLECAREHGHQSVAIPAIGCGSDGISYRTGAELFYRGITSWIRRRAALTRDLGADDECERVTRAHRNVSACAVEGTKWEEEACGQDFSAADAATEVAAEIKDIVIVVNDRLGQRAVEAMRAFAEPFDAVYSERSDVSNSDPSCDSE